MGSLIAAALARAQGFLLEPAAAVEPPAVTIARPPLASCGPVDVVVTGLSRGSGATTVAAGLAQALGIPGGRSAHLISLRAEPGARRAPPGVVAWELPPALRDADEVADYGATLGRLAAGGGHAAVVWDVCADDVARAARLMQDCDAIVCVAAGSAEPALCTLVCDMLAERYGRVVLVANRVGEEDAWAGRAAVAVPDSRLAAILIARGRTPNGAVGAAMSHIAAIVEEQK
jgi:hypothetical protein